MQENKGALASLTKLEIHILYPNKSNETLTFDFLKELKSLDTLELRFNAGMSRLIRIRFNSEGLLPQLKNLKIVNPSDVNSDFFIDLLTKVINLKKLTIQRGRSAFSSDEIVSLTSAYSEACQTRPLSFSALQHVSIGLEKNTYFSENDSKFISTLSHYILANVKSPLQSLELYDLMPLSIDESGEKISNTIPLKNLLRLSLKSFDFESKEPDWLNAVLSQTPQLEKLIIDHVSFSPSSENQSYAFNRLPKLKVFSIIHLDSKVKGPIVSPFSSLLYHHASHIQQFNMGDTHDSDNNDFSLLHDDQMIIPSPTDFLSKHNSTLMLPGLLELTLPGSVKGAEELLLSAKNLQVLCINSPVIGTTLKKAPDSLSALKSLTITDYGDENDMIPLKDLNKIFFDSLPKLAYFDAHPEYILNVLNADVLNIEDESWVIKNEFVFKLFLIHTDTFFDYKKYLYRGLNKFLGQIKSKNLRAFFNIKNTSYYQKYEIKPNQIDPVDSFEKIIHLFSEHQKRFLRFYAILDKTKSLNYFVHRIYDIELQQEELQFTIVKIKQLFNNPYLLTEINNKALLLNRLYSFSDRRVIDSRTEYSETQYSGKNGFAVAPLPAFFPIQFKNIDIQKRLTYLQEAIYDQVIEDEHGNVEFSATVPNDLTPCEDIILLQNDTAEAYAQHVKDGDNVGLFSYTTILSPNKLERLKCFHHHDRIPCLFSASKVEVLRSPTQPEKGYFVRSSSDLPIQCTLKYLLHLSDNFSIAPPFSEGAPSSLPRNLHTFNQAIQKYRDIPHPKHGEGALELPHNATTRDILNAISRQLKGRCRHRSMAVMYEYRNDPNLRVTIASNRKHMWIVVEGKIFELGGYRQPQIQAKEMPRSTNVSTESPTKKESSETKKYECTPQTLAYEITRVLNENKTKNYTISSNTSHLNSATSYQSTNPSRPNARPQDDQPRKMLAPKMEDTPTSSQSKNPCVSPMKLPQENQGPSTSQPPEVENPSPPNARRQKDEPRKTPTPKREDSLTSSKNTNITSSSKVSPQENQGASTSRAPEVVNSSHSNAQSEEASRKTSTQKGRKDSGSLKPLPQPKWSYQTFFQSSENSPSSKAPTLPFDGLIEMLHKKGKDKKPPVIRKQKPVNFHEAQKEFPEFVTWVNVEINQNNVEAFIAKCLETENRKIAIVLKNQEALFHFSTLMQIKAQNNGQSSFYIDTPSQLRCHRSQMRFKKNATTLHIEKGPIGPLYDFLQKPKEEKPRVLFVNFNHFAPHQWVQANTLGDKDRKADRILLPNDTIVIVLSTQAELNNDDSFARRFGPLHEVTISSALLAHQAQEALQESWQPSFLTKDNPLLQNDSDLNTYHRVIDLYQSTHWNRLLFGGIQLNEHDFQFQAGALLHALDNRRQAEKRLQIELRNAPWHLAEFRHAWRQWRIFNQLECYGAPYSVRPESITYTYFEGYQMKKWLMPSWRWQHYSSLRDIDLYDDSTYVLNPSLFASAQTNYRYNPQNAAIKMCHGWLNNQDESRASSGSSEEGKTQKTYTLLVTRELTLDRWAELLTVAYREGHELIIKLAPGVGLPSPLNNAIVFGDKLKGKAKEPEEFEFCHENIVSVIITDEIEKSVEAIENGCKQKGVMIDKVITVTGRRSSELLESLKGWLNNDRNQLEFSQHVSQVWEALQQNKTVLLRGEFSTELADYLAPLLLLHSYRSQGMSKMINGRLIIVTHNSSLFHYFPHCITHTFNHHPIASKVKRNVSRIEEPQGMEVFSDEAFERFEKSLYDGSSKKISDTFEKQRNMLFETARQNKSHVYMEGMTGIGKTTLIKNMKRKGYLVFDSTKSYVRWFNGLESSNSAHQNIIIFPDETNLKQGIESLEDIKRGYFWEDGEKYLTDKILFVFAGNPESYGHGREMPEWIDNFITLGPLPLEVLYHGVIERILKISDIEEQSYKEIGLILLKTYCFAVQRSKESVFITPRELEWMLLLMSAFNLRNTDCLKLADYCAKTVASHALPEPLLKEYFEAFSGENLQFDMKVPERIHGFILESNHYPMFQRLNHVLAIWRLKQSNPQFRDIPGLNAILSEGESGIGKSELVKHFLLYNRFIELPLNELIKPQAMHVRNAFVYIPANTGLEDTKNYLDAAKKCNIWVVIDEINTFFLPEDYMNEWLMETSCVLIGTQNSIANAGRKSISNAQQRRMIKVHTDLDPIFRRVF